MLLGIFILCFTKQKRVHKSKIQPSSAAKSQNGFQMSLAITWSL